MMRQNPSGAADTLRFLPPDGDPLGFLASPGCAIPVPGKVFRTSPSSACASSAPRPPAMSYQQRPQERFGDVAAGGAPSVPPRR